MENEREREGEARTSPARRPSIDEHLAASCRHYFHEKIVFKSASQPDAYLQRLKSNYRPLNPRMPELNSDRSPSSGDHGNPAPSPGPSSGDHEIPKDGVPTPKRVLYDPAQLEMKWRGPRSVGAGLSNMGNTCFLNSVLQCLAYTPPLFNYLISDHHKRLCHSQSFCAMCELQKHTQRVMNTSGCVVKPVPIVQNLRVIGKHFRQGRQEDAHEFLRYFVDVLQKSSLQGLPPHLDPQSKSTTVIHQIFGGYHCSQVRCSECQKTSETFDPLLDVSLDIKNCGNIKQALNRFTKPDALDGENQYACPFCKKMTPAQKRFTLHRLPNILTIQLKRFDYSSVFGGKINKHVGYPVYLDMRPYMTFKKEPPQWYRLYAVLVHSGYSCRSGHYYCYVRSSNKMWYCLNDAQVYQASVQQVLQQEAYLLFYARDLNYQPPPPPPPPPPLPVTADTPSTPPSQPKVQPDPNFLGKPVKRPPHLDITGSPYVRQKPTGIVPPSPQGSATPSYSSSSAHQQPRPSLPLRKSDIDHTPKPQTPPVSVEPPKPVIPTPKTPSFLPRVITAPSSKKKKMLQQQIVAKMEKVPHETEEEAGPVNQPSGMDERGGAREEYESVFSGESPANKGGGGGEVFIGPLLPEHVPSTQTSPSPKIARVHPQVKPAKPVAMVQPVVHITGRKEVLISIKGLAGESSKGSQNPKPGWKPLGASDLASSSPQMAAESEEQKNNEVRVLEKTPKLPALSPLPEVKKRKKRKKKKRHRVEEDREEHRERKHGRSSGAEVERSRKSNYSTEEGSEESEDERPRKKRKMPQHEDHWESRERKRSRHESSRSRRHSRSSSSGSSRSSSREEGSGGESDRGGGRHRRGREERRERKHGHREDARSRHHESGGGKKRHSSGASQSLSHKSKYRSPSPETRRQRKRNWSLGSDDSHSSVRHKPAKQDSHHTAKKKHHSSDYHHHHHHHRHGPHHHEKNRTSKHGVKSKSSASSTSIAGDVKSAESKSHTHKTDGGHYLEKGSASTKKASESSSGDVGGGVEGGEEGRGVPEVEWDFSLKGEGRRGEGNPPAGGRWDGSRRDDVIDMLTSHTSNQLGTKVRTWEGGSNSVDSTVVSVGEGRERDDWDRELDKGKVKKIKTKKEDDFPSKNPFQEYQNKKNAVAKSSPSHRFS